MHTARHTVYTLVNFNLAKYFVNFIKIHIHRNRIDKYFKADENFFWS